MRHSRRYGWGFLRAALTAAILLGLGISAIGAGGQSEYRKVERDIPYGYADGTTLLVDVYYPRPIEANKATVLYIHGGGWYSGDKSGDIGKEFIPALVSRGYLVIAINYRLAPRYRFPAQIEDVRTALSFFRDNAAEYGIDARRIGVWGDSAGGHLAALLGVTGGDAGSEVGVGAVVDMYGPTDLTAYYRNDNSPHIEHVFGVTDADSDVIKQASPINHVSSSAPPFLLIHGENDSVVSFEQSQAFYDSLASCGVPVEMIKVRNCEHYFTPADGSIYPDRGLLAEMMADFLDKYLAS